MHESQESARGTLPALGVTIAVEVSVFSNRVPYDLAANRIARARAIAPPRFDLSISNPTRCDFDYPPSLLAPLAGADGLIYDPQPCGLRVAREAVASEYTHLGCSVEPERVVLTTSTSEAYTWLFKLLCDPGDSVLVPTPSYPLFEHLARVEGVQAVPYHLERDHGWRLDLHALAAAPEGVRAIVVVHPNNPTGSLVHPDDAAALAELAARRGWAVIADEVFLDYPLGGDTGAGASFAAETRALTFALGGLSKSIGLPQLKLGWIVVGGPVAFRDAALERLEYIADTFLSVGTPVQLALPALFVAGGAVREQILARCRANLAVLERAVAAAPSVSIVRPEGGWSAVVRIPSVVDEEDLVVELLERDAVAVQPGFFFDFPSDGYLVVSLLPSEGLFHEGVQRLLARVLAHVDRP